MLDRETPRELGAVWAIAQGLIAAVVPGVAIAVVRRVLGAKFDNTEELRARPAYRRQIRAAGIGLAAAGIASYVMERVADDDDG